MNSGVAFASRTALACALVCSTAEARPRERVRAAEVPPSYVVSAPEVELRGRPTSTSTVLGLVRRGEHIGFVRWSSDHRWIQVEIGDGELAWVDASGVRTSTDAEPERRAASRAPRFVRVEPAPPPEEPTRHEDTERWGGARPLESRERRESIAPEARVVARYRPLPPHGANYADVRVRVGFAMPGHRIATNGSSGGILSAYEYGATNFAVGAQLGYGRAFGRGGRLHLDAKYLLATLGTVRYTPAGGAPVSLALRDQNLGGGLALGGYFAAAGGIDLRVRVGVEAWINELQPNAPPLSISSTIFLGMAVGLELAMPNLIPLGERSIGFRVRGSAIAPATEMQQTALRTAPQNRALGGQVGGALQLALLANPKRGQLSMEAAYEYTIFVSQFSGACVASACRDASVSAAREGFSAHVGTLGLYYQY